MANAIDTKTTGNSVIDAANKTAETAKTTEKSKLTKTDTMDQQQFLQLLVNQLQNQDPLNPMNSEEFAVQLAQFSQLEQLISINDKLDGGSSGFGDVGNMASFLGHEVSVSSENGAAIADGKGPNIMLDIPAGAVSGRIDFVDAGGNVATSASLEQLSAGNTVVQVNNLPVADGNYKVRAVVVDGEGKFQDIPSRLTGTVEGFVLEPSPALIVNGEEVALEDVKEVYTGV